VLFSGSGRFRVRQPQNPKQKSLFKFLSPKVENSEKIWYNLKRKKVKK
jgi:hypothetical protein